MDLWIRSQDRKYLMKCEAIMCEKTGTGYGLIVFTKNYDFNIATYKTKERALEVLDEIQKVIGPRGIVKQDQHGIEVNMISVPIVYKMPKE